MGNRQAILITGAGGPVGSSLRPRLRRPGRTLRLLDIRPIRDLGEGEEFIQGSFVDMGQMERACEGVDAIIDLARFEIGEKHTEENWELVTQTNMRGAYTTFEAARRRGVKRVVYASTNHVVGFYRRAGEIDEYVSPRPDTYYGVGKAMGEALGSLYHHRFGMDVICVRIGSQFSAPLDARMLTTWLSPDDAGRLFEACISAPSPGYRIVWGVSANTRNQFSMKEGRAIGYDPKDDAEAFAAKLTAAAGAMDEDHPAMQFVGGVSAIPG